MWVFMKAMPWESFEGVNLITPETGTGQPQRFLPVFTTREDAERFAGDEKHLVLEAVEM